MLFEDKFFCGEHVKNLPLGTLLPQAFEQLNNLTFVLKGGEKKDVLCKK